MRLNGAEQSLEYVMDNYSGGVDKKNLASLGANLQLHKKNSTKEKTAHRVNVVVPFKANL